MSVPAFKRLTQSPVAAADVHRRIVSHDIAAADMRVRDWVVVMPGSVTGDHDAADAPLRNLKRREL